MKNFEGRVAVVTGASSGIGLSVARECVRRGLSVVMASQNPERLDKAEAEIKAMGGTTLAVPTDVSKKSDIENLAEKTLERFGGVHLLVNNAGVFSPGFSWEIDDEDWEWVVSVNFWGTLYGIKAFLPHLLEQDEAHIVNVSSAGGLMTSPCHAPYTASKHAVVGLSKALRAELAMKGLTGFGVSLVCPGGVATNITSQLETTGPGGKPKARPEMAPEVAALFALVDETVESGMPSDAVGSMIFESIEAQQFWVLPNAECYFPVFDHELAEVKAGLSS